MKTTKELIIADITAKVKAKLASQKVNLSLVEDIASLTTKGNELGKQLNEAVDKSDALQIELTKNVSIIKKLYPQASKFQELEDKLFDKITKATADLGLKKEDIKGYKQFFDSGMNVNSAINGANKYIK